MSLESLSSHGNYSQNVRSHEELQSNTFETTNSKSERDDEYTTFSFVELFDQLEKLLDTKDTPAEVVNETSREIFLSLQLKDTQNVNTLLRHRIEGNHRTIDKLTERVAVLTERVAVLNHFYKHVRNNYPDIENLYLSNPEIIEG